MPSFMQNADRIVGGEAAPSMIPWQVAMLSGSFQFCGGLYLNHFLLKTYDIPISGEAILKYYSFYRRYCSGFLHYLDSSSL